MSLIDLHTHVLPGVDDGPRDLPAALAMARAHVAAGVSVAAATPHVLGEYPANEPGRLAEARSALQDALDAKGIPLRVVAGGEVGLAHTARLPDETLAGLRLGGGPWLLVEPPLTGPGIGIEQQIGQLHARGHRLLVAHPERCEAFRRDAGLLGRLVDAGVCAQVTATSLRGDFGGPVRQLAERMVAERLIHVLASDAHDDRQRPPGLREPVAGRLAPELVAWMTELVPAAMLAGERLPPMPEAPAPNARRRFLGRRRR